MELLKLISDRYSCRRYSQEVVKDEDILKILEAGRIAHQLLIIINLKEFM